MFESFHGNAAAVDTLRAMIAANRIPQTILLEGPQGVGKATLARKLAAAVLGNEALIERDDLSLEANAEIIADREKWPAEKRNEEPLFFSSHPDFLTFPPDGPMRQISIPQMRFLREQAQYLPMKGNRRVFLIDRLDKANDQAANSLLKTLEEPPPYLILIATAVNAYDLLPTIRSRSVPIRLAPLGKEEMQLYVKSRSLDAPERRLTLAGGSPGVAMSLDLEIFDKRRKAMLALLAAASGISPFGSWVRYSEALSASKSERLEDYLHVLYQLLQDLVRVANDVPPERNADVKKELTEIAGAVHFEWIEKAMRQTDELVELVRRNIQKGLALDAMVVSLAAARR